MKQKIIGFIIIVFIIVSCLCTGRYYFQQKNDSKTDGKKETVTTQKEHTMADTEDDSKEKAQDENKNAKGSTFIKYGDEWLKDDIGVRIKDYYYTDQEAKLEEKYPDKDGWMQGMIGGVKDADSSVEYRFLTLEITNYSEEDQMLVSEDGNTRFFMLKAIKENGNLVEASGSIAYCDKNQGNSGQALHNFGDFKLEAGKTVTVVYGFMNFVSDTTYDWYLSDSNGGLDQDIRTSPLATFMCLNENDKRAQ